MILYYLRENVNALLEHFGIEEPRKKMARLQVEEKTVEVHNSGLKDKKVLDTLWKIWQDGGINAAGSEVHSWCRNKLNELKEQKKRLSNQNDRNINNT